MRLRLEELQQVVKRAVAQERAVEALRAEVTRVLGPAVIAEGQIGSIAEAANERLDVLERTGRDGRLDFRPGVVLRFLDHQDPNVRKFAARVVPEKYLSKLVNDRSHAVRAQVARRVPIGLASEMLKRFPRDDQLRVIVKQRRIHEAGLPVPKVDDEPLDIHGDERLGDSVKQDDGTDLSDTWYNERALRFMMDYGTNIEDGWEELAARRYCDSVKATSGVDMDESKLLKAIRRLMDDRSERAMERSSPKETLDFLHGQEERELLAEVAVMPALDEEVDPVRELVEGNLSPATYIDTANSLFQVREARLPASIRKYQLDEVRSDQTVPVIAYLPHRQGFRSIDERALDAYCGHWNEKQRLRGEPLKLEWSTHPDQVGKVSFNVVLR